MKTRFIAPALLSLSLVACGGSSSGDPDNSLDDDSNGNGDTASGDTGDGDADTEDTGDGDTENNNSGSISGDIQFVGLVSVNEDVPDSEVSAGASFIRYESEIAGNLFEASFTPELDLDTCTVETIDSTDLDTDTDIPDFDNNLIPEFVSAGEVAPFTSSAGSYIELHRKERSGFQFYVPEPETVPGPLPSQLTLNIPGEVFPAFTNVNMPTVQSLVVMSPEQNQPITPTTSFSWTPGTNADAYISISALAFSFEGTGTGTIVTCVATDDGQFSFPTQTQSDMGASFNSLVGGSVERKVLTVEQQGNAVLILSATSGN